MLKTTAIASSAFILGGGTVIAVSQTNLLDSTTVPTATLDHLPSWVSDATNNHKEVLSTRQMLMNKLLDRFVEDDHLFEAMKVSGQIKDFRYFYDARNSTFQTIVNLGKEVCGFPATVHGGLTAAIVDETLGGLALSEWRQGRLGFAFPAYTARLELDYKKKIPAGTIILCSTHVERIDGRKMWMSAKVTDGGDTVFATAKALFVAPRALPAWMSLKYGRGRSDSCSSGKVHNDSRKQAEAAN
eukprot:CAMPEP_0175046192 /NCGR_PEP_ID=MMETSP0052_2-20121109/4886_1 /TAXON_ID=51329 ORGANISM="Polytomella parva, Strain SAG 63-3" /NCGR_SAMPLE_ID=MMETSP0052_2 /ASSEMBLY_ACC=CAM_ASM_000194 /LENGTH=242 /DNA_ID=CAMNT_0016309895 /DNA_START=181 /DNA_END=909 /DNA_ORIENTATION=-